jgi:hypothetical protein
MGLPTARRGGRGVRLVRQREGQYGEDQAGFGERRKMQCERAGDGSPLVMLAGPGSTTRLCAPLADQFGQRYKTIIY